MEMARARELQEACRAYDVAWLHERLDTVYPKAHGLRHWKGEDVAKFPEDLQIQTFPIR